VFTYDGRQVCAFKPQGFSAEGVSRQLVSLSSDTLATAVGCSVRCYETAQGRPVGEALNHSLEVKAVCLSQVRSLRALSVLACVCWVSTARYAWLVPSCRTLDGGRLQNTVTG
jgi:hypothetical protein